jgi:hypothetical protein
MPLPPPRPVSTPGPSSVSSPVSVNEIQIGASTSAKDLDNSEVIENKKKRLPQYWAARIDDASGYIMASTPLGYSGAFSRMMGGQDVLAINKAAALALVAPTGNFVGPEKHRGAKGFYLYHYHVRYNMSHVFYFGSED